jgi:hypothetical protein
MASVLMKEHNRSLGLLVSVVRKAEQCRPTSNSVYMRFGQFNIVYFYTAFSHQIPIFIAYSSSYLCKKKTTTVKNIKQANYEKNKFQKCS